MGWYLEGRVDLGAVLWRDIGHANPISVFFLMCWYQEQTFHVAFPFTLNSSLMLPNGKSHNVRASGQLPMKFTSSEVCSQSPTEVRRPDITASMFPIIKIHTAITKLMYILLFQKPNVNVADQDSSSCWYKCHKHYSAFIGLTAWPFTLISAYIF